MGIRGFAAAAARGASPVSAGAVSAGTEPVSLDDSQAGVLALAENASAAVIGAPGTGKTTTLVELVADRVLSRGWAPESVLALTSNRATATRLRDRIATRLALPTNGPMARSATSLAFELASAAAARDGGVALRLITGGEQDSDFAGLLAGHLDDGTGPAWPDHLAPQVRTLRGFRTELRELFMRITEYGVSTDGLRQFASSAARPEWSAAADFFDEYLEIVGALRPGQADSVELVRAAAVAIGDAESTDRVSGLRLVVVDDLQEATESTITLLRALAARGVAIVAFGDPDVAANSFRGGEPESLGRFAATLGLPEASTVYLDTVHRHGTELRALTSRVVARIGTAAAGPQRAAAAAAGAAGDGEAGDGAADSALGRRDAPIVRIEASTPSRQFHAVARVLRERHLLDGVRWNDMVVIVRSGALVPTVARALALAEVPTRTAVGGRPLRDDRAALGLLGVVDVGMGRSPLDAEAAVDLLLGPFGGLDQLALRRLRLALRAEELAGGGTRLGGELLADALASPGRFATIDHRIGRQAERMAATIREVREAASGGATIEELLWLVWDGSGLARTWRDQALGAGITATEANRDLDGIVALFTAAKRFVEREPGSPAAGFLAAVLDAEVPEDTLSPQPLDEAVLVTTPAGVVGLEFEIAATVGVQDGGWPNLRLRGSLLHAQRFVDAVTGLDTSSVDPRKQVLADELRLFALAVSRARGQVIVAAVASDDEAPSVFFSLLPVGLDRYDPSALPPLSLRGITGRLRRELVHDRAPELERAHAEAALAALAAASVPGADPDDWHGLLDPSTDAPLYDEGERIPVSPSQLAAFEASPLEWFISFVSGSTSSAAMGIGTIVHWAMETATDATVDSLVAAIESRWNELQFESPWISEYQKNTTRRLATGVAEYLGDFRRSGATLVGAESRFELDVGRAVVRGSIDRVELADDGAVVIVDLKTGQPITSKAQITEHPQLMAYQLAYAAGTLDDALAGLGEHRSGGAKLLFVKSGVGGKSYREAVQAPLGAEQIEGFRRRIEQAASLMAAAEYLGVAEPDTWAGGASTAASAARLQRVRAVSSD